MSATVRVLDFFVPGIPQPEGSLKALIPRGMKRPIVIHDDGPGLRKWRTAIGEAAHYYMGVQRQFAEDAIEILCTFTLPRPRTVTREYPTVPPDGDKLARSVLDACKGVIYRDDAQVVHVDSWKYYAGHGDASPEGPGVHIVVSVIGRLGT